MTRTEARRRRQDHVIHSAADDVLIGVEPEEATVVGNIHRIAQFFDLGIGGGDLVQEIATVVLPILENVTESMNFDVGLRVQNVFSSALTAAAAADQAHLDSVAAGRMHIPDQAPVGRQRRAGDGRGSQKVSTR